MEREKDKVSADLGSQELTLEVAILAVLGTARYVARKAPWLASPIRHTRRD